LDYIYQIESGDLYNIRDEYFDHYYEEYFQIGQPYILGSFPHQLSYKSEKQELNDYMWENICMNKYLSESFLEELPQNTLYFVILTNNIVVCGIYGQY